MDSPESTKSTTTTCETSIVQPVKAPSVTQGFPGLNSPPLVFTSPRLNPQSQPTFLKRAQFPRPSFAKLSGQLEDGKNCITTVEGNEDLGVQPSTSLVGYGEKGSGSNNTVNDLIQSPCEQFLTDIVIVESVDPDFSFDSTIKKSEYNDQPQEAVTCSKEVIVKLDHGNNSRKSEEIAVVPPVISSQTEELYKENTLINVSVAEENEKQGDGVSNHCPKVGPELPVVSDMANQEEADSLTENVEAGKNVPFNQSTRLLLGSDDIGQESKNSVEAAGTTSAHFFHKVRNDLQAFQHRWARRRCLQFEDAQHKVVSEQPAQDHSNSEGAKSPSLETPLCPTNREHDDVIQPMLYPRNSLNSLIKIPKPTGIGLHLNSIVNTVQAGSSAIINVKAAQWESDLANTDVHESHASVTADSTMDSSNHGVKPSNNSVVLNSKANQSTPGNKRKATESSVGSQEFNNLSPEKKRMKSPDSSDGDGCKRCNCKRSKCLKLYCDCFAAGIYCAEPCACQDCFNRPEYEDTVLDTRQRIESRDPFAFAPKVVGGIIEQPASSYGEDGTLFTPASARHKKGCKCKKSMCLKKYCECYQSNVGCSDGCRCEGCKNVYGKKGEFGMTKVVLTGDNTNETTDDSFFDKCQLVASENATYSTQYVNPQALTPLTPAVQFSNHGKDASKVWFPSYPQSPESGSTYVAPYVISPEPPRNSDNNMPKEYPDLVSLDQGSHHGNADTTNEFSAARRKPGMTAPGFGMPNFQKWPYNSKAQSFSANINDYSGGTLIWRGSPVTPTAQFNESKVLQGVEFDVDLSNMLPDGTPEILRDTTAPLNTVKVSSPNKKRVTPPHGQPCVFGSSSSVGIRTGRKFILKAVPSFPPLTPCVDSKTSAAQQESNPENHSANK